MERWLEGPALVLFALAVTWGLSTLAGRWLTGRKRAAQWIWNRSGVLAVGCIVSGLVLAALGMTVLRGTAAGPGLTMLGSLLLLAGLWLLGPLL